MVASKLETYRAHNKTVEKTIFTGLTTKWLSKHICTETIRIKNTTKTKFTQGYFQFQKQHGRVGVWFAVFFFFQFTLFLKSLPNVYSCLASLSVSLPFLFFYSSDNGFLCIFSRLIYDEYNNPLVTCVYIEPVPRLGVCAVKHQRPEFRTFNAPTRDA